MEYTIRKALPNDISEIIALCAEHAAYEKANYQSEGKSELLMKILFCENPQLHCLVAETGSRIIGYATFSRECSTWNADFYVHMDCLFLREEYRGYGIGEAFVKEIVAYATATKAHHIEWQTPVFNHRAIKFYHRIGAVSREKLRFTLNF